MANVISRIGSSILEGYAAAANDQDRQPTLQERKKRTEEKIKKTLNRSRPALVVGSILILVGLAVLWLDSSREKTQHVAELMIPGLGLVGVWWIVLARKGLLEEQLQDIEFEIDLDVFQPTNDERRAEKLLQINRLQLRRYYDLNLAQNSRIFAVGVLCIVLGVGVIGFTLYLLSQPPTPLPGGGAPKFSDKLVLGLVGAVGSLLTNYVQPSFSECIRASRLASPSSMTS
jgi:hypothetical protein